MLAIIDYGVGNVFSLRASLEAIGQRVVLTADPETIAQADRIILPGVGAFSDAIDKLKQTGLDKVLHNEAKKGKPILGICLGMQLLFDTSYEFGVWQGLGLIPGAVRPIAEVIDKDLKIPHIGWNALHFGEKHHPLFATLQENDCVYFVHSFYATDCAENVIATCEYSAELTAAVALGNVMGCQFHPEKSGDVGLSILRQFCEGEVLA